MMITRFWRTGGSPKSRPAPRRSPRRRVAWQGCVCIAMIIVSALALNTGERVVMSASSQTITLAVPLATTADAPASAAASSAKPATNDALLATASLAGVPAPPANAPQVAGKLILVSEQQQWMWVYAQHKLVGSTAVTTGRPQLATPRGTFHVLSKAANLMFYSPWPPGSPYYYTPEHIFHALYFRAGGFYIHDASWREMFGPGSNLPHINPDGTHETGSHGCINVTVAAAAWLYHWADIGTTIMITA